MQSKKITLNGQDAVTITLPDDATEHDWQLAVDAYSVQGTKLVVDCDTSDNPAVASKAIEEDPKPGDEPPKDVEPPKDGEPDGKDVEPGGKDVDDAPEEGDGK